MITFSLPDSSSAVKGNYTLYAVFTKPGAFEFPLGVTLQVYDICDDSYFQDAPVLSPDHQNYYIGQSDLDVVLSYSKDYISLTTSNICGTYAIVAVLDSEATTITGGSIDSTLTKIVIIDETSFKFFSNQPGLSGTLKYDINVVSDAFASPSPITTWSVNLRTCD